MKKGGTMFALILVGICIIAGVAGQLTMKSGMNQVGAIESLGQLFNPSTLFRIFSNPRVIIGIVCYVVSLVLWLAALSTLNVSYMYPLLSLGYIITAAFAYFFLNESISVFQWVGITLVVGGVFLITWKF